MVDLVHHWPNCLATPELVHFGVDRPFSGHLLTEPLLLLEAELPFGAFLRSCGT